MSDNTGDFTTRKIIHVDMDAFFAAVEQRERPELRGRPVIVGGKPGRRGVVAAASYEARAFGVHSAMPSAQAAQLCPEAVFVKADFATYKAVSAQVHAIFRQYTELIEPLSIDEAFLDVTGLTLFSGSASRLAQHIRMEILQQTGLTASAGIAYNKFLAKVASDINKPNGQYVITPAQGRDFVAQLPIGQFYGVGRATEAKMQRLGIYTGADLRSHSREWLLGKFGKSGAYYYQIARGIDLRPVRTHRQRKSLGAETTLPHNLRQLPAMLAVLEQHLDKVLAQVRARGWSARTLTIKVKFADFTQVTRSHSFAQAHGEFAQFQSCLLPLLQSTAAAVQPVRLLGVSLSGFSNREQSAPMRQLDLF